MRLPELRDGSSPNFGSRGDASACLLVLHYTGMISAEAALARLCDPQAQVSAHYVIDEAGIIHHLVAEAQCAWHAGVSFWRGMRNVNPVSIGVEIVNPGHEWGYRPFPPAQMEAVAALSRDIVTRHGIEARNVVGHSDVAPQRKEDPGELFDWAWLAAQGVGLWPVAGTDMAKKTLLTQGDSGREVFQMQSALAAYGYEILQSGDFDDRTRKVAIAFQRHFRPRDIEGTWDAECTQMLDTLLKM